MKNNTNRRQFIETIAITAAATTLGLPALAAGPERTEPPSFGFLTAPYLQALTPTSIRILFITSKPSNAWIEFGEGSPSIQVHAEEDGFKDANQNLFSIPLTELTPGTRYSYRVVAKEIVTFSPYKLEYGEEIKSDTFQFSTPEVSSNQVSCLILNDVHDRPDSFRELIALNGEQAYEFVLLNGDMFDYQVDEKQLIDHLIAPCTDLFASQVPFILSRGNHETRGKFARNIKSYFSNPSGHYYYSFQQGPVHWIVLDTGEDKPDDEPVYAGIVNFDEYREKQARWLEKEMTSKAYQEATFKVVFMHIPPFHSGDWHGTVHCRELFSPLFEQYKIDMVISGHTHSYGVHKPQTDHSYPIIIGGGPKEGTRTLMRLEATQNNLSLEMKNDSGETVGEYQITK